MGAYLSCLFVCLFMLYPNIFEFVSCLLCKKGGNTSGRFLFRFMMQDSESLTGFFCGLDERFVAGVRVPIPLLCAICVLMMFHSGRRRCRV
jgi:hypothetical protein